MLLAKFYSRGALCLNIFGILLTPALSVSLISLIPHIWNNNYVETRDLTIQHFCIHDLIQIQTESLTSILRFSYIICWGQQFNLWFDSIWYQNQAHGTDWSLQLKRTPISGGRHFSLEPRFGVKGKITQKANSFPKFKGKTFWNMYRQKTNSSINFILMSALSHFSQAKLNFYYCW